MCGIAGFGLKRGRASKAALKLLGDALAHRGPDGDGYWVGNKLGLVHKRLSIVDVEGGRQPFVRAADGREVALVANGEIYNYQLLQAEMVAGGFELETESDCEPPLGMYLRDGVAMVERLRGMFGLAIADDRDGTLVLARDRFGIKPLYYVEHDNGVAFASEPRALVASGWAGKDIDDVALGQVLGFHYSSGERTLWRDVKRLLPGEIMMVRDGVVVERQRLLPELAPAARVDDETALRGIDQRLRLAIESHLQGDVPVGVFMSGGLDSTSLVVGMHEAGVKLRTFTARFADAEGAKDEGAAARALAEKLGSKHVEVIYGAADFWPGLVEMAFALDDVVIDYAALPLLKLAARARKDVKVVLSGEGGDEMLAGYKSYQWGVWKRLRRWWRGGEARRMARHFKNPALVREGMRAGTAWSVKGFSGLQKRQSADVAGWLADDLLLKLDRTLMVHGVEGRVPFLDDGLAAYAFALSDRVKVRGGWGKWILRERLRRRGFDELAFGKKQGFSVPVAAWLGQGRERVERLWRASGLVRGMLTEAGLKALVARVDGREESKLAFSLCVLACWDLVQREGRTVDDVKALVG